MRINLDVGKHLVRQFPKKLKVIILPFGRDKGQLYICCYQLGNINCV